MSERFEPGEYIIYQNGSRYEIGRIKSIMEDGAFVYYSSGETAAKTPFECMHKLVNRYVIRNTSLGGDKNGLPDRQTGKWIDAVIPNDNGGLPVQVCDQCNTFYPLAYTGGGHRFCPNCGAQMIEGGESDAEKDA